ncbi:MAG: hypothetical protein LBC12_01890, partial [Nitrososphaerota archaeon]|nr:hypothetical protein [Nitrososphaerota archaeon]
KKVSPTVKITNRPPSLLDALSLIPEHKRVYIDECGIKKGLMCEYGRVPRCKCVEDVKCGRKFYRLNVVGGLLVV